MKKKMLKCAMGEGNMKTIAIVATGGTIAGRGQIGNCLLYTSVFRTRCSIFRNDV